VKSLSIKSSINSLFLYIFWWARVCRPLLRLCRPFMIFEGYLDSNPECCRSKLARYRLSHPSHLSTDIYHFPFFIVSYDIDYTLSVICHLPVVIQWHLISVIYHLSFIAAFFLAAYTTLQGKSHLCIPFLGIVRPQSQFPHWCVCERFIYSQDRSTYFPIAE
jgi:hypothetical protein